MIYLNYKRKQRLKSQVQFTDYYPEKLVEFCKVCQAKLDVNKKVKLKEAI